MTRQVVLEETSAAYAPTTTPTIESILAEVRQTNEPVVLVRDGKPIAAVVPISDYQRFTHWRAIGR